MLENDGQWAYREFDPKLPPIIWENFKLLKHEKSVFYVASFTRAFISNINSATRDSEEKQYHQNAAEILTRPKKHNNSQNG